MVTLSMFSRWSCAVYSEYEISGAASAPFPENWMIATGTNMTNTQNESCFETLLQFVGFFGFLLLGICIGITASSLCTANGGSSPRDPTHIQPETHAVHRNQRTLRRASVLLQSACATAHRSRATSASCP